MGAKRDPFPPNTPSMECVAVPKSANRIVWLLIIVAFGTLVCASSVTLGQEADTDAVAAVAENAEAATTWMDTVDTFFGKYLVAPLAKVLFFDFGTGKILGEGRSIPFVVAWMMIGATFFTFRMGFINVRGFFHALRVTKGDYDDPKDIGDVTHFQALCSALSATIGLGNIAGVAIAVGTGGPGAIFWMILACLLYTSPSPRDATLSRMPSSA